MRGLIQYFVDRSLLVNIISVMILVAGVISAILLQKETFPNVSFDVIVINTVYPGSSAEDVEKLVSIPIERALREVDGIKELNMMSGEGVSIGYLEIEPDVDVKEVVTETRNALESINDFPDEVEVPKVRDLNNKQRSVLKIALIGENEMKVRAYAKDLQDELELIKGVTKVELEGYREEIIDVALNPKKLTQYEVTVGDVTRAIQSSNLNLSAGTLHAIGSDVLLRTMNEFNSHEDIKEVVVRSNLSGQKIKVSDVADVELKLVEETKEQRANGEPAIYARVKIQAKADILTVTNKVKEKTEKYFEENKDKEVKYLLADDASFYVKRRLGVLTKNGMQGLFLVFCCLLLFMNFRVSVITSLGAPIAFLTAFSLMDGFGVSLNLISMFGLILVLGMLVDDSIIVAEHFYQYLEKGMKPKEAATRAALETIKPVTGTILTTIVAFGALFFMGGIMGKFLWSVPAVVVICLFASWIECFFILPNHLAEFVKINKEKMNKRKWYQPLMDFYEKTLKLSLRFAKTTNIVFILLFVISIGVAKTMRFELFPSDDVTVMFVNVKGPVGTPFSKTNDALRVAEKITMENLDESEFEMARTMVGKQFTRNASKTGSHYGSIILYLTMADLRERNNNQIIDDLIPKYKEKLKGFEVSLVKGNNGPPKGKPVNVELSGDSLQDLLAAANKVEGIIKPIKGIKTTEIDFETGKEQLVINVKKAEARRLGLTVRDIAFEVRRAYEGDAVTEIRRSDEDVDIKVRLNRKSRGDVDSIMKLYISNAAGRRIKLSQVATLSKRPGAFLIRRYNRKRTISVSAEINRDTTSRTVNKEIKPKIDKLLKDYKGMTYVLSGENKDTKESMTGLMKAGIIATFCIFIILIAMFSSMIESAIIMSAIPFGLIGVVFTFLLMGKAFGFMAFMGIVGLVGVVVNDSIVLVNFINLKTKVEKLDSFKGIMEGAMSRFRPVILTTFTTVAGLLPIAHAKGGDPFLKPMALSFAYGLLFSTTITLIFIPTAYYNYTKFVNWIYKKRKKEPAFVVSNSLESES